MSAEEIIKDAIDELKEGWKEADYPEDLVNEIADSSVPVYYNQIAELAQDDISLLLDEPELGPCTITQLFFCKIEQTLIFLSGEELHAHHRTG